MIKEFNSLEEIQKYYDKETNTYVFKENGECIDIKFNFNLNVDASIKACNIKACNINANDIKAYDIDAGNIGACDINAGDIKASNINAFNINAWNVIANDINALDIKVKNIKAGNINAGDINAWNIDACDISYWAVCFAYNSIKCKSITSKRENHKHFVLDGELEVEEDEKED